MVLKKCSERNVFIDSEMCSMHLVQYARSLRWWSREGEVDEGRRWRRKRSLGGTVESGNFSTSTCLTGKPGGPAWELPDVELASYLDGGLPVWMRLPTLHANQKDLRMAIMMIWAIIELNRINLKVVLRRSSRRCPRPSPPAVFMQRDIKSWRNVMLIFWDYIGK